MEFAPGHRVELVTTSDPPPACGPVIAVPSSASPTTPLVIDICWDNGSTLAMFPSAGDQLSQRP